MSTGCPPRCGSNDVRACRPSYPTADDQPCSYGLGPARAAGVAARCVTTGTSGVPFATVKMNSPGTPTWTLQRSIVVAPVVKPAERNEVVQCGPAIVGPVLEVMAVGSRRGHRAPRESATLVAARLWILVDPAADPWVVADPGSASMRPPPVGPSPCVEANGEQCPDDRKPGEAEQQRKEERRA